MKPVQRASLCITQELLWADSDVSCRDTILMDTLPLFLWFSFQGNHRSEALASLGKQDYGAQSKDLCHAVQVEPGHIIKVLYWYIQIKIWEKINWCKQKQKIWTPFMAEGLIWPKQTGLRVGVHGKEQGLSLGDLLFNCIMFLCFCFLGRSTQRQLHVFDAPPAKKRHHYHYLYL